MQNKWLLGLVVLAAMAARSRAAHACSCAIEQGIADSVPEAGAEGVPTDVVPWVDAWDPVTLVDDEGNTVPTESRHVTPWSAICEAYQEIVPSEPLQPNTEYTLVAEPSFSSFDNGDPLEVKFTTGEGPLALGRPEAPDLDLVFFDATAFTSTCNYFELQACLYSDHQGLLSLSVGDDADNMQLGRASVFENLILGTGSQELCFELRARDLAGRLSDPVGQCLDPASLPVLDPAEFSFEVDCNSEEVLGLPEDGDPPEDDRLDDGDGGEAGMASDDGSGGASDGDPGNPDQDEDDPADPDADEPDAGDEGDAEPSPESNAASGTSVSRGGCSVANRGGPLQSSPAPWLALLGLVGVRFRARRVAR